MLIHAWFESDPAAFVVVATLLGLIVGSFLNVVIHRLPIMMERAWREECRAMLAPEETGETADNEQTYNLVAPSSQCPACGHRIRAWQNIPILSYLLLRGRCAGCATPISIRYPLVEALTGALSLIVVWHFGYGWAAAAALVLTWSLIALSVIDAQTRLLPDSITLPIMWLGLLVSLGGLFTDVTSSLLGAVFGYLSLWAIYHVFRLATGKEGMGFGDFKLLAMLGAWLGWQALPLVVLLSSLVGAGIGLALIVLRGRDRNVPMPFGPYLAAAGWLALLWGDAMTHWYLHTALG